MGRFLISVVVLFFGLQPMPEALVAKQIAFDTMSMLIMGGVTAFISR